MHVRGRYCLDGFANENIRWPTSTTVRQLQASTDPCRANVTVRSHDAAASAFVEMVQARQGYFASFNPAISAVAKKAKGRQIRAWHLNLRSSADLPSLADAINPQVRGWVNYYGAFYRSELNFLAWRINHHLARWAMRKFKRFKGKYAKAMAWLQKACQDKPGLFAHWQLAAFTSRRTVGAA